MAMRTASPWWTSLALLAGSVLVFFGERIVPQATSSAGTFVTWLGVLVVLLSTGARLWTWMQSTGARKSVEGSLLLYHAGVCAALGLYALSTGWGVRLFGITEANASRFATALTILWVIKWIVSMVPLLLIEVTLGTSRRTAFDLGPANDADVEVLRVRDANWSGLTLALAACLLMVTCGVANERNVRRDVSYFQTSSPGESTRNIVASSTDPVRALLFFPAVNEVKSEVSGYFDALAKQSGGKVVVEHYDQAASRTVAEENKVSKNGTIVLLKGDKRETLELDLDIEKARRGSASKLRKLDSEINSRLIKLMRAKRKAYLTVGHGEINDYESVPVEQKGKILQRQTSILSRRLGELNYEVKTLPTMDLARGVPEDATLVMMLGPAVALTEAEVASLDAYLVRGGRLLAAIDPAGDATLGALAGRLGIDVQKTSIVDPRSYFPGGEPGEGAKRWIATNSVSAHASTTTMSRVANQIGLVFIDSGSLREFPPTVDADKVKKTIVVRSMPTAFADTNNDLVQQDTEKADRQNLAASIEGPMVKDGATEKPGWRAMVFADSDLFADISNGMRVMMVGAPLFDDAVKWLGGEEIFAGEIVSTEDKPIVHTSKSNTIWFVMMLAGAPLLVVALGLFLSRRRVVTTEGK